MIAVNEFKERRRKLLEKMEDFSVAVIFAGASKIQSEDETCPYLANRNFYYLTNIEQENSILILLKGCGNTKEYLFVSEYDEVKEKWYGKRLTSECLLIRKPTGLFSTIRKVLGSTKETGIITWLSHLLVALRLWVMP